MNNDNSSMKLIIISVLVGVFALIGLTFLLHKEDAPVTLPIKFEEFTDFQCPYCALYHPIVKQITSEFSDNVDYRFVNYPLLELHPNVKIAHQAVVAAGNQGKFNEYANLLFENQDNQLETDLIKYAVQLNLDVTQFTADLNSQETIDKVNADMAEGESRGINATPTFFINGERVIFKSTDNPETVLREKIQELINKASAQ